MVVGYRRPGASIVIVGSRMLEERLQTVVYKPSAEPRRESTETEGVGY
jgi:hypothetical protein